MDSDKAAVTSNNNEQITTEVINSQDFNPVKHDTAVDDKNKDLGEQQIAEQSDSPRKTYEDSTPKQILPNKGLNYNRQSFGDSKTNSQRQL